MLTLAVNTRATAFLGTGYDGLGREAPKIHRYQYLIELSQGRAEKLEDLEVDAPDPATRDLSTRAFRLYEQYMVGHYRRHAAELPGTSDVFRWLKGRGMKMATDTSFHRNVNEAIMEHINTRICCRM